MIEHEFEPTFGISFLLNESEEGWPCNIFIYDCSHPDDPDEWYGYLPDQLEQHKYPNNHINISSKFIVFKREKYDKIHPQVILDRCKYPNRKLYKINRHDINKCGFFGIPVIMHFEYDHDNLFVEMDHEYVKLLQKSIPASKHQFIGFTMI